MPGKWGLHRHYSKHKGLRSLLPQTSIFSAKTLEAYLSKYPAVYIKPNLEHMGKGIMKVWKTPEGYALVKVRGKKSVFATLTELKKHLETACSAQQHIIQEAIPLATIKGRPFDVRVMMMRNGKGVWTYFGTLVKVAGPTSIVTNTHRAKGYVTTLEHALAHSLHLTKTDAERINRKLIRLSHDICSHFDSYKRTSKIGIDFAIDKKQQIWLIEVNFNYPGYRPFAKLPDKTAYYKILRGLKVLKRVEKRSG